jgi:hypothetical protein
MNPVAIVIVFALAGGSLLWALWMLVNWIRHGCPDRYPYPK